MIAERVCLRSLFHLETWPGEKYETGMLKIVCFHEIKGAAGRRGQNTEYSLNGVRSLEMEKRFLSQRYLKSVHVEEFLRTARESICGRFPPSALAWVRI